MFDSDNRDKTTDSTIPSELGLLTQLSHLDIDSNELTSTIPSEIARLTKLAGLDFGSQHYYMTILSPQACGLHELEGPALYSSILHGDNAYVSNLHVQGRMGLVSVLNDESVCPKRSAPVFELIYSCTPELWCQQDTDVFHIGKDVRLSSYELGIKHYGARVYDDARYSNASDGT